MSARAWVAVSIAVVAASSFSSFCRSADPKTPEAKADSRPADSKASEAKANARIARLIRQLGNDDYFMREQAEAELLKAGPEAFDALGEAIYDDDLEIAMRAQHLRKTIRVALIDDRDPPRVQKMMREYESGDLEARYRTIQALSRLMGSAGLPALCRIVRYETAEILSKAAAIEVLGRSRLGAAPDAAVAALLRRNLEGSRRPAAHWLLALARYESDPAGAIREIAGLAEEEMNCLRRTPDETTLQIIVVLRRVQVNWLEKQKRSDEALAVVRESIDLLADHADEMADFVDWLIDQKAWSVLDDVARRHAASFHARPALLYAQAQSQAAQGHAEAAETLARQALATDDPLVRSSDERLRQHLVMGRQLWRRGMVAWAEREFRTILTKDARLSGAVLTASFQLSEMLHDKDEDLKAAEVLRSLDDAIGKNRDADEDLGLRKVKEIRSRMHYFYACDALKRNQPEEYKKHLDRALAADPGDVDVLIACYRLEKASDAGREKTRDLIAKAAAEMRQQIREAPEDPQPLNQFAWLIGNTEGDYDEAVRCSQKSIELSPDASGYFDTLARCYYAKKDYASAVQFQTKALEMEPHSGLLARQLELFKKALEGEKK